MIVKMVICYGMRIVTSDTDTCRSHDCDSYQDSDCASETRETMDEGETIDEGECWYMCQ